MRGTSCRLCARRKKKCDLVAKPAHAEDPPASEKSTAEKPASERAEQEGRSAGAAVERQALLQAMANAEPEVEEEPAVPRSRRLGSLEAIVDTGRAEGEAWDTMAFGYRSWYEARRDSERASVARAVKRLIDASEERVQSRLDRVEELLEGVLARLPAPPAPVQDEDTEMRGADD